MTIPEADQVLASLIEATHAGDDLEIFFGPPSAAWSKDLASGQLAVGAYLAGVREDLGRRRAGIDREIGEDSRVRQLRPPLTVELQYLVSVFAADGAVEREHALLSKLALAVFGEPTISRAFIPDDAWLPEDFDLCLRSHAIAGAEFSAQFWASLGQPVRPALSISLTIPMKPTVDQVASLVGSRLLRFDGWTEQSALLAGWVCSSDAHSTPIAGARITLTDPDHVVLDRASSGPDGRFSLTTQLVSDLVLEARAEGYKTTRRRIDSIDERSPGDLEISLRKSGG